MDSNPACQAGIEVLCGQLYFLSNVVVPAVSLPKKLRVEIQRSLPPPDRLTRDSIVPRNHPVGVCLGYKPPDSSYDISNHVIH